MDFARRAWDHSFPMDPIVRTLLDTDFYKFLMGQMIWEKHFNDEATFALSNRTKSVRLGDMIDLGELREQLDHVRSLRFQANELIWLRGQTFYGQEGMFSPSYIDFLRRLRLPDYELGIDPQSGQVVFETHGRWAEVTFWEIYVLSVVNELRNRAVMKTMGRSQLDILYARAKVKLYAKLERLAKLDDLNLTDFGTRRRHGFLWQEHCILTAREVLGDAFTGTSNAFLALKHGLEARGTNAHELPMALAALCPPQDEACLAAAQYKVLQQWQNSYRGGLLVFLPDTFGTSQFLANAPQWVSNWTGARPDSKPPVEAGEELIAFWERMAVDPKEKLIIFSDGMDVEIPGFTVNGSDIVAVHDRFHGRVRLGFGWGTMLTNDFLGCHPTDGDALKPISLVCKLKAANGHPAVKLSDNYSKATGPAEEVARYRAVFGSAGLSEVPTRV
ncbi:nicotinate phosphoribosyltransferase [Sphingosinicella sp. BN140058]|uniref:nicotinate phosphoribosyltransferase n=1 Tax=Sphingosinicella sp. BN140058 TaxID=1892855 RepID=UPI001012F9F2|nr:nicotinate phosphoribosyltransferase [Sphingosinicella sp. BN140058]QAY79256.1 nicotinate phosphoribosyltransferase [Sphingosinicella sp. BN140058]